MKVHDWLASLTQQATPDMDECVAMLGDTISWLHRLKATEQDAEWHAEGNVHIHTNMVLQELYQLLANEAQHIQGSQRQAIILGTLLHDIAKPIRTRPFEIAGVQRIGAPQHEAYGRSYLAFKLLELALPFQVVWTVLNLVGEHHMPKRLSVKNGSQADYQTLARQADTELLYWLEVADMRGRICPDLQQQLLYL
ncbi:MAG: HD domain-containing protein, partial [Thiolinea sp.]